MGAEARNLRKPWTRPASSLNRPQRDGDSRHARAKCKYGMIPELEKKLQTSRRPEQFRPLELREEVTEDDIASIVSRWTGIPVDKMLEGEREKLLAMEDKLTQRVVGQDDAVKAVSDAGAPRARGPSGSEPPLGSFLFLGPTGVGKTELTKALAAFLFDDDSGDGAHRHVRIHGEAQRRPPDRRAAGLCRL
jgi:ATP-dependent Clp protease ATP-binding subunit ClpB